MHTNTKQGLARTLEVTIAVIFTFLILAFLMPQARVNTEKENNANDVNVNILFYNEQFRSCLLDNNTTCIEHHLQFVIPAHYTYAYVLTPDAVTPPLRSSTEETYTDSEFFFVSNATDPSGFSTYRFILYYW